MNTEHLIQTEVFNFLRAVQGYEQAKDHRTFTFSVVGVGRKGSAICERDGSRYCFSTDELISFKDVDPRTREIIHRFSCAYGFIVENYWDRNDPIARPINDTIMEFIHYGTGPLLQILGNGRLYQIVLSYAHGSASFDQLKKDVAEVLGKHQNETKTRGQTHITQQFEVPALRSFAEVSDYARALYTDARRTVVGQDASLREVITRIVKYLKNPNKPPVLLAGPTGCGKTLSVDTVADLVGIPKIVIGMDSPTPTGYVGTNFDVLVGLKISELLESYGGNYPKRLLIFLDEFDKILRRDDGRPGNFSVQIQSQLLRLMQPNAELTYTCYGASNTRETVTVPFRGLVFMAGAFSFIPSVAQGRISRDELRNAGFMDELVGRMSITTPYRTLGIDDYERILTSGACRTLNEGLRGFGEMGLRAEIERNALQLLAEMAAADKSGARSLTHNLEDLFTRVEGEIIFTGRSTRGTITITRGDVERCLKDRGTEHEEQKIGFRVPRPDREERRTSGPAPRPRVMS